MVFMPFWAFFLAIVAIHIAMSLHMAIFYRCLNNQIIISGRTYAHKERIKALGARFQFAEKTWVLDNKPENLRKVALLCEDAGGGQAGLSISDGGLGQDQPAEGLETKGAKREAISFPRKLPMEVPRGVFQAEDPRLKGFSVAEVVDRIALTVSSAFPRPIWVIGEVQNLNPRRGGFYFQLAEPKENGSASATVTLNSTLWQSAYRVMEEKHGPLAMKDVFNEGVKVRFLVQVKVYQDRGYISLNVLDLDPNFTKGALLLARELLLKELRQKGLDEKNKRLILTDFPLKVGLVSADQSRAKSDFMHQLEAYGFPGTVLFESANMQGEAVLTDVGRALAKLEGEGCDVIVLTRGGGSAADLRWFDSREVSQAIYNAGVPIICAIGHHDDVCVAEEISYRREKTPTAAADFINHVFGQTREKIRQAGNLLSKTMSHRMELAHGHQQLLKDRIWKIVEACLHAYQSKVENLSLILGHHAQDHVRTAQSSLANKAHGLFGLVGQKRSTAEIYLARHFQKMMGHAKEHTGHYRTHLWALDREFREAYQSKLDGLDRALIRFLGELQSKDPKPWLKKGWTQLEGEQGLVSRVGQVRPGEKLKARLRDGLLEVKVASVRRNHGEDEE